MNFVLDRNGMNPKTKREKWKTSIWGFSEREEITPLGGSSKISEEDPPLRKTLQNKAHYVVTRDKRVS